MEKLRLTEQEIELVMKHLSEKLSTCQNYTKFHFNGGTIKNKEKYKKPTLLINAEAYLKMFMLVDIANEEISWHGLVKRKDNIFNLYDIVMFPQINTSVHSGTDGEEYAKWMYEKQTDEEFPSEDLRCHGHSHVQMGTSASSTDDAYQEDMIQNIENGEFYIFMILNKQRSMNIYLYDFEQQIMFTEKDINLQIMTQDNEEIISWAVEEIDKNVTVSRPTYSYKYTPRQNRGGKRHGFKQK